MEVRNDSDFQWSDLTCCISDAMGMWSATLFRRIMRPEITGSSPVMTSRGPVMTPRGPVVTLRGPVVTFKGRRLGP